MEPGLEYVCVIVRLVTGETEPAYLGLSRAAFSGGVLELSCPLSIIEYPDEIDMVFQAEIISGTDWAPNTGYVTYTVDMPSFLADGDPSEWAGIPWLCDDELGGVDTNEDIQYGYVTDDGETLFLRVDLVEGAEIDVGPTFIAVFFDTDCNPESGVNVFPETDVSLGDIGADYLVVWPWGPPGDLMDLTVAYQCPEFEFLGSVSSQHSGNMMEMAVPLKWMGNPDEIDIVFVAAIAIGTDLTIPVRYAVTATVESCDSLGVTQNTFDPSEDVYAVGSGYAPSTVAVITYPIYVVEDVTWTDGMMIPARVPGTATTVSSDILGEIVPTLAWSSPLTPGKYDIVVDVNRNGFYNEGIDALDDSDIQVTAGFFVIPEYPLGTILGLIVCLAALGVFNHKRIHVRR